MAANPPPNVAVPEQRVYIYIDGANLFNSAKRRFGYKEPNCDIAKLARAVVALKPNRKLLQTHYYIGVPEAQHDARRNAWWNRKLMVTGKHGVKVIRRKLKPRELVIDIRGVVHHNSKTTKLIEKGIDLRLGLDLVKHTLTQAFDVAIIFSQDGDLAEAVQDAYELAAKQKRRIAIECAYPIDGLGPQYGISKATALEFDRVLYDACIDPSDYNIP
jgi:uncharacterized LabA/DUF88 family protein